MSDTLNALRNQVYTKLVTLGVCEWISSKAAHWAVHPSTTYGEDKLIRTLEYKELDKIFYNLFTWAATDEGYRYWYCFIQVQLEINKRQKIKNTELCNKVYNRLLDLGLDKDNSSKAADYAIDPAIARNKCSLDDTSKKENEMTKDDYNKELLTLIEAFIDRKTLQVVDHTMCAYYDAYNPDLVEISTVVPILIKEYSTFPPEYRYRVKPQVTYCTYQTRLYSTNNTKKGIWCSNYIYDEEEFKRHLTAYNFKWLSEKQEHKVEIQK